MNEQFDKVPLFDPSAVDREQLVRLCARLTGRSDVAEDLAQETMLEAWRHRHKKVGLMPVSFALTGALVDVDPMLPFTFAGGLVLGVAAGALLSPNVRNMA